MTLWDFIDKHLVWCTVVFATIWITLYTVGITWARRPIIKSAVDYIPLDRNIGD